MTVTYTNRKGATFLLCQGETKTGKPRYYFARAPKGKPVTKIPSGYEISESVNGVVSLVKLGPRLIAQEEIALVEKTLNLHPDGKNYRVKVRHHQITIYEGDKPDLDGILEIFGTHLPPRVQNHEQIKAKFESRTRFTAIMRFTLSDPDKRTFIPEQCCFQGSVNDWIAVGGPSALTQLAQELVPALGSDVIFELC